MMRRWDYGIFAILWIVTISVPAEELLTERRAIEWGMSQPDVSAWLQGQRDAIAAQSLQQGYWQNPQIEYIREDMNLPLGNGRETSYWLKQRFNISGQLGLERKAAHQQRRADEANVYKLRQSLITDIRSVFYQALYASQRAIILKNSTNHLTRLNEIVKQRARAGDSARYDSLRLQREWVLLQGQTDAAQTQADAKLAQLANLIGAAVTMPMLADALLPQVEISLPQWEQKIAQHPQLENLAWQIEAQRLTAKAAGRAVWPELTLGVGQRGLSEPDLMAEGHALSIGLEIPLFKPSHHKQDQASAMMSSLQAEQRLHYQRLLSELRNQTHILQTHIQAVEAINEAVRQNTHSLIEIAEQAYRNGEMQIMELLDAYRSTRESELQYLELKFTARTTYINIQYLIGE